MIVLSYDYWMKRFNGDPGVVGRPVTVDGHPLTIVGVAPKGFHGVQSFLTTAAYLPISQLPITGTPAESMNNWQTRQLLVHARLRPGVTQKQADAELSVIAQSIMRQHPDVKKKLGIEAFPEATLRISAGDPKIMFIIAGLFLSLAALVLLLACVNVANLVLVRATVREREMAIRTALGASRSRLIRQMITESVTLALMGGVAGIVLGMAASNSIGQLDLHADIPIEFSFNFDWRIFLYSLAVAILAGLVVGTVPALRIARSNVNTVLHEGGRGLTGSRNWFRDGLVALQIAGSLVLLVVAALFVRSLSAAQTMDFGFKPDHVLNFVVDSNEIGLSEGQSRDLAANITSGLHQLAGVRFVSHATSVPLGYFGSGDRLIIDGAPAPANPADNGASSNVISTEYFSVMGIDIVSGRAFTDADNEHGQDVAIVSQSTARKFWPNQDGIGRTFRVASEKDRKLTVVGIARDVTFQMFAAARRCRSSTYPLRSTSRAIP